MASALLNLKGPTERIAAIVVGADRVAANGDTANKIGTYQLVRLPNLLRIQETNIMAIGNRRQTPRREISRRSAPHDH